MIRRANRQAGIALLVGVIVFGVLNNEAFGLGVVRTTELGATLHSNVVRIDDIAEKKEFCVSGPRTEKRRDEIEISRGTFAYVRDTGLEGCDLRRVSMISKWQANRENYRSTWFAPLRQFYAASGHVALDDSGISVTDVGDKTVQPRELCDLVTNIIIGVHVERRFANDDARPVRRYEFSPRQFDGLRRCGCRFARDSEGLLHVRFLLVGGIEQSRSGTPQRASKESDSERGKDNEKLLVINDELLKSYDVRKRGFGVILAIAAYVGAILLGYWSGGRK